MYILRNLGLNEIKEIQKNPEKWFIKNKDNYIEYYNFEDRLIYHISFGGIGEILVRDKEFGCFTYRDGRIQIEGKDIRGNYLQKNREVYYYFGKNTILKWNNGIVSYVDISCNNVLTYNGDYTVTNIYFRDNRSLSIFYDKCLLKENSEYVVNYYDFIEYKNFSLDMFLRDGEKIAFIAYMQNNKK